MVEDKFKPTKVQKKFTHLVHIIKHTAKVVEPIQYQIESCQYASTEHREGYEVDRLTAGMEVQQYSSTEVYNQILIYKLISLFAKPFLNT